MDTLLLACGGRCHEVSLLIKHAYSRGERGVIDIRAFSTFARERGLFYRAVELDWGAKVIWLLCVTNQLPDCNKISSQQNRSGLLPMVSPEQNISISLSSLPVEC